MDPRVRLLEDFSKGFVRDKAKIEAELFGFEFLESLLSGGAALEYGALTDIRMLHRYKLVDISEHKMSQLIQLHVMKQLNVCRYFGAEKNDVFCFNLDNNHKTDNTVIIPELSTALDTLRTCLLGLGCEPLVVASGRGYHVSLRLDVPMENALLYRFMIAIAARALLPLLTRGDDHRNVKINFYPDVNIVDVVSLRLFGTAHAKNQTFSHVFTPNGLLNEDDSWKYFEHFMRNGTTTSGTIVSALDELQTAT